MTGFMDQERKRISERIERLDAEQEKLSAQLQELEVARTGSETIWRESGHNRKAGESTPGGADRAARV